MGQKIEILKSVTIGDVAVFDTDRSLSGQDGERYRSSEEASSKATYPAMLAQRLFDSDASVTSVYVFSNAISVERSGGWDSASLEAAEAVVSDFFLFY